MVARYNPQEIEKKWQQKWAEDRLYDVAEDSSRPKWYALTMFPYTSGDLHIGHWYAMAPSDVRARFKRMQGYNVLHPMGFDAFGECDWITTSYKVFDQLCDGFCILSWIWVCSD